MTWIPRDESHQADSTCFPFRTIVNVTLGGAATYTAAATLSDLSDALVNDRLRSEFVVSSLLGS